MTRRCTWQSTRANGENNHIATWNRHGKGKRKCEVLRMMKSTRMNNVGQKKWSTDRTDLCGVKAAGKKWTLIDSSPVDDIENEEGNKTTALGYERQNVLRKNYHRDDVHVVLVNPCIPQNTGTIARSCAASRIGLHIVKPMSFELDDTKLKRAGLDYWDSVFVKLHESWEAFLEFYDKYEVNVKQQKRMLAYSKRGTTLYTQPETTYNDLDVTFLMYGSETYGLSDEMLDDIVERCGVRSLVRIPINEDHVRSLNLSVCVGIGIWDAIRQLDYGHDVKMKECMTSSISQKEGERDQLPDDKRKLHRDMYDRTRFLKN